MTDTDEFVFSEASPTAQCTSIITALDKHGIAFHMGALSWTDERQPCFKVWADKIEEDNKRKVLDMLRDWAHKTQVIPGGGYTTDLKCTIELDATTVLTVTVTNALKSTLA